MHFFCHTHNETFSKDVIKLKAIIDTNFTSGFGLHQHLRKKYLALDLLNAAPCSPAGP